MILLRAQFANFALTIMEASGMMEGLKASASHIELSYGVRRHLLRTHVCT